MSDGRIDSDTPSSDLVGADPGTSPGGSGRHRRRPEPSGAAPLGAVSVDAPTTETAGGEVNRSVLPADAATPLRRSGKPKRKQLTFWQELPLLVVLAVVLAVLIKTFAFQAFVIPSPSMEDTIMTHDRVMTNKLVYDFRDPHRGEVVVFERTGEWPDLLSETPEPTNAVSRSMQSVGKFIGFVPSGTDFIKRVIALPGDTIECCDPEGRMIVNGKPIDETDHIQGENLPSFWKGPLTVPAGQLFVMGDNREQSSDSRKFGTIPIDSVVGRAVFVMWPKSHWKGLRVPPSLGTFSTAGAPPAVGAVLLVLPLAMVRARRRRRARR